MNDLTDASEKINRVTSLRISILNNALIATILTSTTYLIGVTFHQTYSTILKIPYGLYPKTPSEYFLYAFQAFLELFPAWLTESTKINAAIFITILFVTWVLANLLVDWITTLDWSKRIKNKTPSTRLRRLGKAAAIPTAMLLLVFYIPLFSVTVMLLPVAIGEGMAKKVANRDLELTKNNCAPIPKSYAYCSSIVDGEKTIATGYIVDTSENYVAMIENGKARSIPIEGKELRQYVALPLTAGVSQRIPASSGSHPVPPWR